MSASEQPLTKRRRKLPTAPTPVSASSWSPEPVKTVCVEEELKRLSPEVLKELKFTENSEKFMPGEVSNGLTVFTEVRASISDHAGL